MRSFANSWRSMFSTIWSKSSFWPNFSNSAIMFVIISSPLCSICAGSSPSIFDEDVANNSMVRLNPRSNSTSGASSEINRSARSRWSRTNCSIVLAPSSLPDNARRVISRVSLNAGFLKLSTSESKRLYASSFISSSIAKSMRFARFSPASSVSMRSPSSSSGFSVRSSSASNSAIASSKISSRSASAFLRISSISRFAFADSRIMAFMSAMVVDHRAAAGAAPRRRRGTAWACRADD
mmetsp:Transcript_1312/g.3674  ORF Transcript_1312/g.3674 Transcript_1312/m.3674 type:complete len:238 (-) Transcript_1312:165-878(-)